MRNQERCGPESHRETVVDVLGAGFSHAGVRQVHLIKYDRLERDTGPTVSVGPSHPGPATLPQPQPNTYTCPGALKLERLVTTRTLTVST